MSVDLGSQRDLGPIDAAVGARIRIHRRLPGLSQSQLAGGIGVTVQLREKFERGAIRVPASKLAAFALYQEATVRALTGKDDSSTISPVQPLIADA